jgi:protein-disulfide isomerase
MKIDRLEAVRLAFFHIKRQLTITSAIILIVAGYYPAGVFFPERIFNLPRIRLLSALLAICIAVGCKAQSTSQTAPQSAQELATFNRHVQIMIRYQFNLPPDYSVMLGARRPSKFPGYDTLPVVISHGSNPIDEDFLISADGKTLAHFDKFDLENDPVFDIDVKGRPIRGNPDAKVTVINFDDLQCPYCARMHQTLFPATMDHYKDTVRFIYKDFPLTEIHNWALHAAVDANCLAAQSSDAYWNYVDYLHSHGQEISGPDRDTAKSFDALNRIARQQGVLAKVDSGKLDACLAAQDESRVRASMRLGDTLKLAGAPALFINGERIDGALQQEKVWLVIDRALRDAGVQPPPPPPAAQSAASGAGN